MFTLMMQSVGQRSCVQYRLDQRSRVHSVNHWSSMNHWGSMDSVDNWSMVDNRSVVDNSRCSMDCGLQNWSNDLVNNRLAMDLGDALMRDSRGSAVHHSSHLSQDRLMHHMVGLDKTSTGGGNQQSNNSNLELKDFKII